MSRFIPDKIYTRWQKIRTGVKWYRENCPVPPPDTIKRFFLKSLQKATQVKVFVETGTYLGETVHDMLPYFKELHTIELSQELYERASDRFKDTPAVRVYQGDSGQKLPEILKDIHEPALFWLDGHYSEGITAKGALNTPILEEITQIAKHTLARRHIIVVDDARHFDGTSDYPSEDALRAFLAEKGFAWVERFSDNFVAAYEPIPMWQSKLRYFFPKR